jgi:hypothetical protein
VPRARATKPADEADRIDNIVVNHPRHRRAVREIVVQIEAGIAAVLNHRTFAIVGPPSQNVVAQVRRGNRGPRRATSTDPCTGVDIRP